MNYVYAGVTTKENFYGRSNPVELIEKYGSPLYVYNEKILRDRCRDMSGLIDYPNFMVNYSAKANSNLHLLEIIRDEGLNVDAMSPGEIFVELKAGFSPDQILYIGNNVSADELQYALDTGVKISVDSIAQLDLFGRINPGGEVFVRFNPGVGAGHNPKVVTGGKKTKFGVQAEYIDEVKRVLDEHNLRLIGINQHIGSLFMDGEPYLAGVKSLLAIAEEFDSIEYIDIGGGFGIPYHKHDGQERLNIQELGGMLNELIYNWVADYGREITIMVEPGRYIAAECGVLLGSVYSLKENYGIKYVGTDLGFNVLKRPMIYGSHHDIEIYRKDEVDSGVQEEVTIVGNICESGDIIAKKREFPRIFEGDLLGVLDAGAYGFSMASNYNNRLRPAEVLINEQGDDLLIRRRDTLEQLINNF
ncbi:diaminopimelate decarboxylase [Halocella sp. SP3-1]|uniref:diaminopimelate decarboxylase n=1 Tax=Halocella sp. SP3-1 TaxID=2382161 RepID=UPI000F757BC4|nr:diaminopimelate decarboxylase [Halocella sp. SP3-1]AZO94123.1 diaminopimelate decarboxylase [Halocella sp. SP3-1]